MSAPRLSAACFSNEDAARAKIRQAMKEGPHWREGRIYAAFHKPAFVAEVTDDASWPLLGSEDFTLIERHDRAGWLGSRQTADV